MATTQHDELRIAEIPTDVTVDPVTLDIIEGALKNARFEMDAVLFRSAMSPVIREQHDEFPMLTDPRGRMVVGQFGAYINEMMADWDRGVYPGDVILTSDPFKCSGSISHTNDWLVLLPIFYEDELVGWSSQFGHQMDAGGPLPGSLPTGARTIFEEGIIIPPVKIIERGVVQEDVLRADPQQRPAPRDEPRRPVRDRRRLPRGRAARARPVRAVRQGDVPGRAAGAARPDVRGDAHADPAGDPRGAADLRGLHRRRRARQRPVQDEADDLARGRPRLLRLDGHRSAGARADQLLPLRGHVQDVHRDLPDHGQRSPDPLQRRLLSAAARRDAGGLPAQAALPGGARLPHARARPAVRRARRRALQAGAGAEHGGRLRHLAVHALLGLGRERRVLLLDGDPLRRHPGPADRRRDGRPLLVAAVREHPDRVPRGLLPAADRRLHDDHGLRRRRAPSRRQRRREALRLPRAGRGLDPRRPLADAARGACSAASRASAPRRSSSAPTAPRSACPSKCDNVEVEPGDMLVYRTAGGGGWKDRLDRPAEAVVARRRSFGLVSREKALASYGVVARRRRHRRTPRRPSRSGRASATSAARRSPSTSARRSRRCSRTARRRRGSSRRRPRSRCAGRRSRTAPRRSPALREREGV